MTIKNISDRYTSIIVVLFILSILLFLFWLARSAYFINAPQTLSLAVTLDLIITVPLIYFLAIRKKNIPNISVAPFLVLMLILGSFVIPAGNHKYLDLAKMFLLPFAELFAIGYLVYTAKGIIAEYKKAGQANPDFLTALKAGVKKIIRNDKISEVISTEIAVLYYSFFMRVKNNSWPDNPNVFSYSKRNGSGAVAAALCFVILVEAVALHFLVAQWNILAAWILTISSIYVLVYLIGNYRASKTRPILIEEDKLILRSGLLSEIAVPFNMISDISLSSKDLPKDEKHLRMNFLSGHNVILRLNKECESVHIYGIRKQNQIITIYVDDKTAFEKAIRSKMNCSGIVND